MITLMQVLCVPGPEDPIQYLPMKIKFYLLPLLLFSLVQSFGQTCPGLNLSYTIQESRCVATGAINVQATGGSGNYNYQAIGPITTTVTSSPQITGLPPGTYTIKVRDLNNNCSKEVSGVVVPGSYTDPGFGLVKTDAGCTGNDGTISVTGLQNGRSPFSFAIIAPSPSGVGTTNSTGNFTGLTPGEYSIQLQDSCGGIQVRHITVEGYTWWIDSVSVVRTNCQNAQVFIRIKDNKGNVSTVNPSAFSGFSFGYSLYPGDTTFYGINNFSVFLGTRHQLTLLVRDNCGNIQTYFWTVPPGDRPNLNPIVLSNVSCSTFTATATGSNLTNPQYCLYDDSFNQVSCNSTGVFPNLPFGTYCIEVTDYCYDTTIMRCFTQVKPVPSVNANVQVNTFTCSTFTATVTGQSNLISPSYCLYNASNVSMGCNTTGVFTNVPYGTYCIKVLNGCLDSVITRCFTVRRPVATLTNYAISGGTCTSFNVQINGDSLIAPQYCLYDSLGNVITCNNTGIFNGLPMGSYCVRAISCGDTTNSICFSGSRPVPAVGPGVTVINKNCNTFGVSLYGQVNLTNPQYCLYNANDSLLACNSIGVFDSLAYGSYCIRLRNTCYDTTIVRCFTENRPVPSLTSTMQVTGNNCTTVSFKVNGTNLTNPQYCLFDSNNVQLTCNTTGVFNNYPYGRYCVQVRDGCTDTLMQVCQNFNPVRGLTLSSSKPCVIGSANIRIQFTNGTGPYDIRIFHPNGTEVYSTTTPTNPVTILMPALPAGTQYKVVGTDGCGNRDSAMITPNVNEVTHSTQVRAKCPSATWTNGSGDILATCSTNQYSVAPRIIRKNGAAFNQIFSSVSGAVYTFVDLEPATYVVEYTQTTCNGKVYDTVTVAPYAYPSQGQSAVYQCDNAGFSLGADVNGGVSPYTFQIIGSVPSTPAITTAAQSSPIFQINNGTTYSLIRLRTIDACGNAALSDVSVLPLQNISISASERCFFRNITLSVDAIPNATYQWYKRVLPNDSVLLGTGTSYNLPFFLPEQVGTYICRISINNGCLIRVTYFTLDGHCGDEVLANEIELRGRRSSRGNQLNWNLPERGDLQRFEVQRKAPGASSFRAIGSVPVQQAGSYQFMDTDPNGGGLYRLRLVGAGPARYSNTVRIESVSTVQVYPNPVREQLTINWTATPGHRYQVQIINAGGQTLFRSAVLSPGTEGFTYRRTSVPPGIYLVKLIDTDNGQTVVSRVLFE
jgi:hypothetical protein